MTPTLDTFELLPPTTTKDSDGLWASHAQLLRVFESIKLGMIHCGLEDFEWMPAHWHNPGSGRLKFRR